jgi:tRNA A37 threonylcarbamoyladenosine synthetase subunit TsaC/SUA5/YrdC
MPREAALSVTFLRIDRPGDIAQAARAIAAGDIVATAFGNFYAIVAEPSAASVRAVNAAKGRPADQVGSITTGAGGIAAQFAWAGVPAPVAGPLRAVLRALADAGPIGFRGPAAPHLPPHLTHRQDGVLTTQVISPGTACPANGLFAAAAARCGTGHLYVTSANRSRHHTGADEEPAHWTAAGIAADFAHLPRFTVIAHADEARARAAHPRHLPMSVTLVSFPPAASPVLTVERHGSLHVGEVRRIARPYGFEVRLGAAAGRRLPVRSYEPAPAAR